MALPTFVSLAAVLATATVGIGVHGAGAAAPGAASDYFTEAFSDPLDFSNPEDIVVSEEGPMMNATNAFLVDGKLSFDMAQPGYISPLWGGYGGALAHGREGSYKPVDTSRFKRLVFRMNAPAGIPSGVRYYTCPTGVDDQCQGGVNFFTQEGWHTYEFVLGPSDLPALTAPWSGKVTGIRLAFSPQSSARFELDFVQLLTDPEPTGNATPDGATVGPVPEVLNPDAAGAIPVLLNPDGTVLRPVDTGPCGDYTRFGRRGDSWDFSQPSDVASWDNVTFGETVNGLFHGRSAPSPDNKPGDPGVRVAMGAPFRPTDFTRATVIVPKYVGSYSQRYDKGGGWVLRLLWKFADTPRWQISRQIATYPNERVFSWDFADPHPFDGLNPTVTDASDTLTPGQLGWAVPGKWINVLRLDPHEDYESRDFWFDQLWVAQDDCGANAFDILFRDNAFAPGTTADVYVDSDAVGWDGQLIAQGVPVAQGVNTFRWTGAPPGRWWVYLVLHRDGSVGRAYASGPVRIGPVPPVFQPGSGAGAPAPQTLALRTGGAAGRPVCTAPTTKKKAAKTTVAACRR